MQVRLLIALLVSCVDFPVKATSMSVSVTTGESNGRYEDSAYRDQLKVLDFNVSAKTKQWGYELGLERTFIRYKYGIPSYQQDAVFLSYQSSNVPLHQLHNFSNRYYPSVGSRNYARYTTRLDFFCVASRKDKNSAENACIFAPQISYMRLDRSLYADLGFALSDYRNNSEVMDPLRVEQWTPTLGLGLNERNSHWLQLRGYLLRYTNIQRTHQIEQNQAVEAKYFYYPLSRLKIVPLYLETAVVVGERMYAVDRDTASVNNLADREIGGVSISAQWRLHKLFALSFNLNRTRFSEQTVFTENNYSITSTWFGVTTNW